MDIGRVTRNAENFRPAVQYKLGEPSLCFLASVRIQGQSHEGKLMDISLAGALFEPEMGLENIVGAACRVDLHAMSGDTVLPLSGTVIHSEGRLLVIKFITLTIKQYTTLSRDHDFNGGAPELLWRGIAELLKSVSSHGAVKSRTPPANTASGTRCLLQRRQCDRANISQAPAPFYRLTWVHYRSNQVV